MWVINGRFSSVRPITHIDPATSALARGRAIRLAAAGRGFRGLKLRRRLIHLSIGRRATGSRSLRSASMVSVGRWVTHELRHSICPKGATHTSPGCNPGDGAVGMHPGHGRWVCIRDTDGGYASGTPMMGMDARRFGGWGGASHDSQGVALGCHILPRWGRDCSTASPPNPGQPVHNLHVSTLTQRLQAR